MKTRAGRNDIDISIALELWGKAEIYTIPANNELTITIVGGYKVDSKRLNSHSLLGKILLHLSWYYFFQFYFSSALALGAPCRPESDG